jgi:hypothetical protein
VVSHDLHIPDYSASISAQVFVTLYFEVRTGFEPVRFRVT